MICPCHSKKPYVECCKPYHEGTPPENALKLMRSRYSAYALSLADYIMHTTYQTPPSKEWKQDILTFSQKTLFEDLTILEFIDGEQEARVTFRAQLSQNGKDVSFIEKSLFIKENGKWFYKNPEALTQPKR